MKIIKETVIAIALLIPVLAFADDKSDATLTEYTSYNDALHLVKGARFDSRLSLETEKAFWLPPVKSNDETKMTFSSKDGSMAVEYTSLSDTSDEIVARIKSKAAIRGSITILEDRKTKSHTFTAGKGQYTVTSEVCAFLRHQMGATSLTDFEQKAKSCSEFYKSKPIPDPILKALDSYQAVHIANVARLRNSVARDVTNPDPVPATAPSRGKMDWAADLFASANYRAEKPKPLPKNAVDIFTVKSFPDETSYRAVLAEVAGACARFFSEASQPARAAAAPGGTGTAPAGAASGAATSR